MRPRLRVGGRHVVGRPKDPRVVREDYSTTRRAPLVSISEAGLSKHRRTLAHAGVLEANWEGHYVVYSLRPDRVEPLSAALLTFLGREPS